MRAAYPRPAEFCEQPLCGLPAKGTALRFFKSDRLLGSSLQPPTMKSGKCVKKIPGR